MSNSESELPFHTVILLHHVFLQDWSDIKVEKEGDLMKVSFFPSGRGRPLETRLNMPQVRFLERQWCGYQKRRFLSRYWLWAEWCKLNNPSTIITSLQETVNKETDAQRVENMLSIIEDKIPEVTQQFRWVKEAFQDWLRSYKNQAAGCSIGCIENCVLVEQEENKCDV